MYAALQTLPRTNARNTCVSNSSNSCKEHTGEQFKQLNAATKSGYSPTVLGTNIQNQVTLIIGELCKEDVNSQTTQVTLKDGEHCKEDVRGQMAQGLNSVPVSKYRESQPIPRTKVQNEINREQEPIFPREIAVILQSFFSGIANLGAIQEKNGPIRKNGSF